MLLSLLKPFHFLCQSRYLGGGEEKGKEKEREREGEGEREREREREKERRRERACRERKPEGRSQPLTWFFLFSVTSSA